MLSEMDWKGIAIWDKCKCITTIYITTRKKRHSRDELTEVDLLYSQCAIHLSYSNAWIHWVCTDQCRLRQQLAMRDGTWAFHTQQGKARSGRRKGAPSVQSLLKFCQNNFLACIYLVCNRFDIDRWRFVHKLAGKNCILNFSSLSIAMLIKIYEENVKEKQKREPLQSRE